MSLLRFFMRGKKIDYERLKIGRYFVVILGMESLRIDIVNPKAKRIIKDLAELNLISIRDHDQARLFQSLLKKLRSKKPKLSYEDITREVELVRAKRNDKKG